MAASLPTQRDGEQQQELAVAQHVAYITSLNTRTDRLDYWLTEHLRLNGVYWGLTALHLLGQPGALDRAETVRFVLACQHEDGGFGAAPGHDAHMLYTVSAVQVLATVDALDELEKDGRGGRARVAQFIANLQDRATGAFKGDKWGETDTRFIYGAFLALSLLGALTPATPTQDTPPCSVIDVDAAVSYIERCQNLDGGFGSHPGAESHAGQVLTCVAALALAGRLQRAAASPRGARLAAWLSERQLPNGGLNGRPEKLEDVCYSWWVAASLAVLGRLHWVDRPALARFILRCQDAERGGIADRPGDMVDVYHTHFGVAGLALLGYPGLQAVNPV
ncbi:hypothetical protein KEM52_000164 [Ascosphaera acerosa]|nr:hypothetical protein KEM52_000164 [Ascosphaera acerosa]